MASPGSTSFTTWSELMTTTYRAHRARVTDNVSNHNALYRRIMKKGKNRHESGGLSIVEPLDYQANSTYQRYSGYDTLNIGAVDVLSAAEFSWKQVAVNVAVSGLELRTNSGENRIINFTKAKIQNAMRSLANGLSTDLYSDGSAANQIGGIQAVIADTPTNTVGGISSNTWTFWKNIVQSAAAPLQGGSAITPSASTIESLMLPLWLKLVRGADAPDLIVMSDDYFTFFEQSQTSLKRYAPEDDGQAGMLALKYKTADVVFDSSGGIPSAHAYFINTDFLDVVVHSDADGDIFPELQSVNQDAMVTPILWMGNVVTSCRKLQGVMKA